MGGPILMETVSGPWSGTGSPVSGMPFAGFLLTTASLCLWDMFCSYDCVALGNGKCKVDPPSPKRRHKDKHSALLWAGSFENIVFWKKELQTLPNIGSGSNGQWPQEKCFPTLLTELFLQRGQGKVLQEETRLSSVKDRGLQR